MGRPFRKEDRGVWYPVTGRGRKTEKVLLPQEGADRDETLLGW